MTAGIRNPALVHNLRFAIDFRFRLPLHRVHAKAHHAYVSLGECHEREGMQGGSARASIYFGLDARDTELRQSGPFAPTHLDFFYFRRVFHALTHFSGAGCHNITATRPVRRECKRMPKTAKHVGVCQDPAQARYGFGEGHPFGADRFAAFWNEACNRGLDKQVLPLAARAATRAELESFHIARYLDYVTEKSVSGGYLDDGDTPAVPGILEAAGWVVGATLNAAAGVMKGAYRRAFVPIAGLHHAGRDHAAGFCVLNDIGVAVEYLRREHGVQRIAYVDIDAHHGDGVFYGFESDPDLLFADLHEDGRFLYPGTGRADETGQGAAAGTKLNIPLPPGAGDGEFHAAWQRVEQYLHAQCPQFILFQCGADSLAGDPITHLRYTPAAHAHAAARLCAMAEEHCAGRIVGLGGGGYNRRNLAQAWSGVVEAFLTV